MLAMASSSARYGKLRRATREAVTSEAEQLLLTTKYEKLLTAPKATPLKPCETQLVVGGSGVRYTNSRRKLKAAQKLVTTTEID
ncbi:hypothetical protein MTR_5g027745 [Medicago truncatula]|uniref:Uncharacterized protein n=1 Tax=Medicago truncatula TaxID=3880 RepID=A0A072UPB0_MEDTR|nr:hypothetical protein MTR_5g027745 [Medicago truncatula]